MSRAVAVIESLSEGELHTLSQLAPRFSVLPEDQTPTFREFMERAEGSLGLISSTAYGHYYLTDLGMDVCSLLHEEESI